MDRAYLETHGKCHLLNAGDIIHVRGIAKYFTIIIDHIAYDSDNDIYIRYSRYKSKFDDVKPVTLSLFDFQKIFDGYLDTSIMDGAVPPLYINKRKRDAYLEYFDRLMAKGEKALRTMKHYKIAD